MSKQLKQDCKAKLRKNVASQRICFANMAIVEAAPISGKGTAGGATNKPTVADQMFCSGKKRTFSILDVSMFRCHSFTYTLPTFTQDSNVL